LSGIAVTIARGGSIAECPFELGAQLRLVAFDEQEVIGPAFSNGQGNRFVCERRIGCDDSALERTFISGDFRNAKALRATSAHERTFIVSDKRSLSRQSLDQFENLDHLAAVRRHRQGANGSLQPRGEGTASM
jgi:hypothetical protein